MKRAMSGKRVFVTLFWAAVLIGIVYAYLSNRNEIGEAMGYLQDMNIAVVLLLIPVIFCMWRTAGGIWHPYLKDDGLSAGLLSRIQYEINFVNTVLPFFSITGAAYTLLRLKKLGVSEGKASGMIVFRYIISISTKWIEIAIAMVILAAMGKTGEMPAWIVWAICILIVLITAGFAASLVIYQRKVRVPRRLTRSQTLGKTATAIQKQMDNLFQTLDLIFSRKGALLQSFLWGMIYSLLEVLPFWVVATAMGHPELLLPIIIASGVAITVGIIIPTPMGIGGFDGAMILLLGNMGNSVALVSALIITTRILVLGGSEITGIPFWMIGMRSIEDKE